MAFEKINTTDDQTAETNVNWVENGERANDTVLNRPIKQISDIINANIDSFGDEVNGILQTFGIGSSQSYSVWPNSSFNDVTGVTNGTYVVDVTINDRPDDKQGIVIFGILSDTPKTFVQIFIGGQPQTFLFRMSTGGTESNPLWGEFSGRNSFSHTNISKQILNGETILCTAPGLTITLPANPGEGFQCSIIVGDFVDTIIARNGATIMDIDEDMTINKEYIPVKLTFLNNSWRIS